MLFEELQVPLVLTECSSWVLRTEAVSSGYCRPFPVCVSVKWLQMALGTSPLGVPGEPSSERWMESQWTLRSWVRGVPWHLECLLVLLVPDDSPARASIFSLADRFASKPPQKLFGQGFWPWGTSGFCSALLAVGLPTLEPWRTLAGPLQSVSISWNWTWFSYPCLV